MFDIDVSPIRLPAHVFFTIMKFHNNEIHNNERTPTICMKVYILCSKNASNIETKVYYRAVTRDKVKHLVLSFHGSFPTA